MKKIRSWESERKRDTYRERDRLKEKRLRVN